MELFKSSLRRSKQSRFYTNISQMAEAGMSSKMLLLHAYLRNPGPPVDHALDWVGPPAHRLTVVALLCGDFFLARYAGNYFVPKSADALSLDIEPNKMCIYCWHYRRQLVLEGEGHVLFECPQNDRSRRSFLSEVTTAIRDRIDASSSGDAKLLTVLGSTIPSDWAAFGRLAARVRQNRRHLRRRFEQLSVDLERHSFTARRDAWRVNGGYVCRHGVSFKIAQGQLRPCISPEMNASQWIHAQWMSVICHDLKNILTASFDPTTFKRLGQLGAEMRRLNYS